MFADRCRIAGSAWPCETDAVYPLLSWVTRLSRLCHCVLPGQAEDADFFGCWLVRARCLKSGSDDDAAELGGHVGGRRLGLAGVPGGAGPVVCHVGGVVAGGGIPAGGGGPAGGLGRGGPLNGGGGGGGGPPRGRGRAAGVGCGAAG